MDSKKSIPLDHSAIAIGLFVAIVVVFQQIAVIVLKEIFTNWGMSLFDAELLSYILSLLVLVYYINKIIKGYYRRRK